MADELLESGRSLITIIPQYAENEVYKLLESGIESSAGDHTLRFWWNLTLEHSGGHELFRARGVDIGCKKMLWYVKGNSRATGYIVSDPIKSEPPDKTLDEWAQSPKESEYLIEKLTEPNWTVLDPFMGTGTNGIATLNKKRNFIGMELLQEKYELARAKLFKLGDGIIIT
jgi:DNA modification methylase